MKIINVTTDSPVPIQPDGDRLILLAPPGCKFQYNPTVRQRAVRTTSAAGHTRRRSSKMLDGCTGRALEFLSTIPTGAAIPLASIAKRLRVSHLAAGRCCTGLSRWCNTHNVDMAKVLEITVGEDGKRLYRRIAVLPSDEVVDSAGTGQED